MFKETGSEIDLQLYINTEEKIVYLGKEDGAGAEYSYKNFQDLIKKIKFYLENYCGMEAKKDKNDITR